MFRMFSFLPPIGCYVLAIAVAVGTYSFQSSLDTGEGNLQSQVTLVGGILAFLLVFAGFQKSIEQKGEAQKPRVSSAEVMQKLTPTESGTPDPDLDIPPQSLTGPADDSPLGRVRARSETMEV
ncbi:MAG: hypothetical protein HKN18_13155 [Silicimonas sp.]|nr:hypothetical protein [Silicimonas sp.]